LDKFLCALPTGWTYAVEIRIKIGSNRITSNASPGTASPTFSTHGNALETIDAMLERVMAQEEAGTFSY
jgi:hypothetical protein